METKTTPKLITMNQALAKANCKLDHMKQLLRDGKVKGTKQQVGTTQVLKWYVDEASLDKYIATRKSTGRADGRNKYNIYLTPEELAAVTKAFPNIELRRANISTSTNPDTTELEGLL